MNAGGLALAGVAAAVAAAMNAAAGGGSFVSFPMLVFLGVPPIPANATNSSAMWVGGLGTLGGFRGLLGADRRALVAPVAISVAGGLGGGLLLLHTPSKTFSAVVPWLLLLGTLLFAAGPLVQRWTQHTGDRAALPAWSYVPLFLCSLYGGFFGGGQGILLLALFALAGMTDLGRMNALKTLLAIVNNGMPLIPFVLSGVLLWNVALVMCAGALAGGYWGARVVRRLPPAPLRWGIVAIGAAMSAIFFVRHAHGAG